MFTPTIPASRQNRSQVLQVPMPTLGLHCSLEARARRGLGEQLHGRDVVQLGEHQHHATESSLRANLILPWAKFLEGTEPTEQDLYQVLGTSSAFCLHQLTCLCPHDKPGGLTALPAACIFHPGLFLHPQISLLYLTLVPLGSKAQMAYSSLGVNVQGEGGVGKIPARAQLILLVLNAFQMYLKAPEGRGVPSHCS